MVLPQLPIGHQDFISYVAKHPGVPVRDLLQPFNERESSLRELFAQSSDDDATKDPHVNAVPIYAGHEKELKIKARDPDNDRENSKYIMPLNKEARMSDGSSAVVETLGEFKKNFSLFSESSLADLDWNNVVVAGSAVVTSLLPVSKEHKESTRALRTYYHDKIAPSSDVDLFLWGLTEEQAIEKIKDIEKSVKNSILAETTTIRTKYAVTVVSQYPVRHVQIVLRIYKSVSEILTGFDVDSSCFAFDGSQVYGTPRGIASFLTQCNVIDLSRRSPSYENRLAKYAARGFEIFCSDLERERVDATIFDRSFARVQGLARLLVLERLPKESDRENYRDRRRFERARPKPKQGQKRHIRKLRDNFKDKDPQDVAEWVMQEQDDVSNYHSFTIPYGPRYNAKKIEKLVYTKDLLLNAEWNSNKDRTVNLHRHPCFVGDFEFIINDCCTTCPEPKTQEERDVAEEENKKYVSRTIEFIEDDPGRQSIGSFHPLTSADWTQQAYLGGLEPLYQAIVDGNRDFVQDWCKTTDASEDHRDHTGRTPLHLACLVGKTEIVQILVDAGARLVSRLADGLTPLHIACIRGDTEIINVLLEKSEANEEIEAETTETKRGEHKNQNAVKDDSQSSHSSQDDSENTTSESDHDSIEIVDNTDGGTDTLSIAGSFVKVPSPNGGEEVAMDKESEGPDVYDINTLAWDNPVSPLHLAIICGHTEAVRLLVNKFGADVLVPVKLPDYHPTSDISSIIMTLTLAARNSEKQKSVELTKLLLDLGASPSQSDSKHISALQSVALAENVEALKIMIEKDLPKSRIALKHITIRPNPWNVITNTPLTALIAEKAEGAVRELLEAGTSPTIGYDEWAKAYMTAASSTAPSSKTAIFEKYGEVQQPIVLAAFYDCPSTVELLLDMGADMNQLDAQGFRMVNKSGAIFPHMVGKTLLDIVEAKSEIPETLSQTATEMEPPILLPQQQYTHSYAEDSYQFWQIQKQCVVAEELLEGWDKSKSNLVDFLDRPKKNAFPRRNTTPVLDKRDHFKRIRDRLVAQGARTFRELHPEISTPALTTPNQANITIPQELSFEIDFEIPSVHDANKDGYIQLFEAAWRGDKEMVRSLTCKPDHEGNVLRIAVHDNMGITPLHIAIWRGEYDIAELMLEIADLQHAPDDKDGAVKRRYHIRSTSSDDYSNDSDEEEDEFYISSDLVDQDVAIEDIAKLAKQVGSKTQAIDFLSWSGQFWMFDGLTEARDSTKLQESSQQEWNARLQGWYQKKTSLAFFQSQFEERSSSNKVDVLEFAISTGNINLVNRIMKWTEKYSAPTMNLKHSSKPSQRLIPSNRQYVFQALRLGHAAIANKLVAKFGADIPVESFIDEAGIPDSEATKYYQGLLLRGKRRKDWNRKANKTAHKGDSQDTLRTTLLLHAIASEGVDVIEWCLSDTPRRLLIEYMSQSKDQRIKQLVTASEKPDNIVEEWLNSRRDIALHMAVLSNKWESKMPEERAQAVEVLKYLIRAIPESLETKSATGYTPLALAFWTRRAQAAAILIEAGANQTIRDYSGANIFHLAVNKTEEWSEQDAQELDQCLALVDGEILLSLSTERCSFGPTGMTPLATWLWRLPAHANGPSTAEADKIEISVLEILLKYMDEEALYMVDGGGQMPLHSCMRRNSIGLLELLCTRYPKLISLENGMGQTAIELCYSMFIQEAVSPINMSATTTYIAAGEWDSRQRRSMREPIAHDRALAVLKETISKHGAEKERILISSLQSTEVSKRLADAETKMRKPVQQSYRRKREEPPKDKDEVERWLKNNKYSIE